jgi:TorA maturation chaperone TorD
VFTRLDEKSNVYPPSLNYPSTSLGIPRGILSLSKGFRNQLRRITLRSPAVFCESRRRGEAGYFLFSRLFREPPDLSILTEVVEKKLLTMSYYCFEEVLPEPTLWLEEMEWLKAVETIAVEYTALFVTSGEDAIPPYESFYGDTISIDTSTADSAYFPQSCPASGPPGIRGLISGPSRVTVEKVYRQAGYNVDPRSHHLPDHVACELEFMGRLYTEGKPEMAMDFLKNHLGRWVFLFLDKVKQQKRSVFYSTVALSLERFLRYEAADRFP